MSDLKRPVEDLAIKPLLKRRVKGESHGVEDWLELLEPLMGNEAQERYQEMLSGKAILLNPELFGAKTHYLKQVDMKILDVGMGKKSFDEGVVKGLQKGSRAKEAGLRKGDRVVSHSYLWRCVGHFEQRMEIVVEREGVESRIEYWPRSYEMAKTGRW